MKSPLTRHVIFDYLLRLSHLDMTRSIQPSDILVYTCTHIYILTSLFTHTFKILATCDDKLVWVFNVQARQMSLSQLCIVLLFNIYSSFSSYIIYTLHAIRMQETKTRRKVLATFDRVIYKMQYTSVYIDVEVKEKWEMMDSLTSRSHSSPPSIRVFIYTPFTLL